MQNFLSISLDDSSRADKISMAISELLENAVKYSISEDAYIRLEFPGKGGLLQVIVQNQAEEKQAKKLLDFVDNLNSGPPLETYMELMKKNNDQPGTSQLGLARIRYESEGEIQAQYTDNRVTMSLVYNL